MVLLSLDVHAAHHRVVANAAVLVAHDREGADWLGVTVITCSKPGTIWMLMLAGCSEKPWL
jgi:hypothetical protein